MREGWQAVQLGEVLTQVQRPVVTAEQEVIPFAGVHWYGGGVYKRDEAEAAEVRTRTLNQILQNDITYNRMWATKAAFGVVGPDSHGCLVTNDFPIFTASEKALYPGFMSLVFNQPGFQRTAAALATGTTERRRLKETDFLTITIPLPPLLDQRRIVELVGSVTRALQATLAESSKARIAFETLGESAWESNERVSLGTLGEVFTGKTPSTKIATYWEPAGVPFVTPGDIGPGLYVRNAERSISEAGARKVRVFPPTTVLQVCIGATIGKVGLLGISAACNQQVNALVGLDEVDAKFLTIVLGSSSGTGLIRSTAGHTTMPILKKSAWLELIVPWPRRQMREKLSSLTTTMDQLAAESIEYSKSLRSLQAALINDLLTGARRIPDTYDNLVNMP